MSYKFDVVFSGRGKIMRLKAYQLPEVELFESLES